MNVRTAHKFIRYSLTLLLLAGFTIGTVKSEEYRVVVPNVFKDAEAPSSSCRDFGGCVNVPFRQQFLYPAEEFSSLPQTELAITGWYLRPDHTATARSGEIGDLRLRLSTTDKDPAQLSTSFDSNLSTDVDTVFDGPIAIATQAIGPGAGPLEFDYYFPLQAPFLYDPSSGRNLISDLVTESGFSFVALTDAFVADPPRAVLAYNAPNALVGGLFELMPVVQWVFEPVSPADFNLDLTVNHEDLTIWESGYGSPGLRENGDANGDGLVTGDDFLVWQRAYVGAVPGLAAELGVPEPNTLLIGILGCAGLIVRSRIP